MKFGQLEEYNLRDGFPEKSYTECGWKASSRLLSKESKLSITLDQQGKEILCSLIWLYAQVEACQNIKTKVLTTCFHLI